MKVTDNQIREAISQSSTMREAATRLEINFTSFAVRAKKLGLYLPNQGRRGVKRPNGERANATIPLQEILEGKHPQYSTSLLKKRLFKEKIKCDKKCEKCSRRRSVKDTFSLVLDHKNGVHNDHRLENLQVLCPNCNSMTDTFAGRNKGSKKKLISDTKMVDAIMAGKTNTQVLLDLGMSASGANYRRVDKIRNLVEYITLKARVA